MSLVAAETKSGGLVPTNAKGVTRVTPDEVARLYELLVNNVTEMNALRNPADLELGKVGLRFREYPNKFSLPSSP